MLSLILTVISLALTVGILLLLLVMKSKAKDTYDEYVEFLDKKEYSLKDFFPAGFYFNDSGIKDKFMPAKIKSILYKYNMKVKAKILEIYGPDYWEFYMQVHNANKFVLSSVAGLIFALLSLVMATTGDTTTAIMFIIFSLVGLFGLGFALDSTLDGKITKRRNEISLEFPEFVNKLTLLVNAGMTISKAWEKVVTDNKKTNVLYDELKRASAEISAGKPESVAYEDFAKRCKIKEIMKFVSVIVLNLKKGGAEVVPTLKMQGDECWEARKATAKRLGEEASSKIMLPLMMMFIGVIIIVAFPAIMGFMQGF